MCSMTEFDHPKGKIFPSRVHTATGDWNEQSKGDHFQGVLERLFLALLQPVEHLVGDVGHDELLHSKGAANSKALYQFVLVSADQAFHKGEAVLWVLDNVVLDGGLDFFLLVFDQKAIGQITVLLEANLLGHCAIQERLSIAEEDNV